MNLKKWKGIYVYFCWDWALVFWEINLPGRGLTKVEKHCFRATQKNPQVAYAYLRKTSEINGWGEKK